jgi:uncharacterized membrane protein YeaQ/YmgE (transglycosylase-associated protein family)
VVSGGALTPDTGAVSILDREGGLVLLLGIILFGMIVGGLAQFILGRGMNDIDWPMAFGSGLLGSFVGGLLASLLAGDGLELRASGLIGSLIGAVLVTLAWQWWRGRQKA